jgi:Na+/proline symporter
MTRSFFFDNPKEGTYFWKQFLAGIFLVIATTGLDQDLMQRTLSCKNPRESQKNLIVGALMQIVVIGLFLFLGFLLYSYANQMNITEVASLKGDDVFPFLATGNYFPVIVGVLFIIGFIAAAYSAAGGALTALTTSFTVDILNKEKDTNLTRVRTWVHIGMAIMMAACIYVIHLLNDDSVIQTVYKVASYTYGPLLGMFCFGIFTKKSVRDRWIPLVVILAPVVTWVIDVNSVEWFNGYVFSHERLILNALLTYLGMVCLIKKEK